MARRCALAPSEVLRETVAAHAPIRARSSTRWSRSASNESARARRRGRALDRGRGPRGHERGRARDLADLRRAGRASGGVAHRGHPPLAVVAQRDGRRAARDRAASCDVSDDALSRGAEHGAAERRVQPAARVRMLRGRATTRRRGAHAPRGGARVPRHARPAHGPAQPHADPRPRRADARALRPAARRRWRRCSSTSTTSRASTTRSATASATNCCAPSQRGSRASCARPTRWDASAATSSW